MRAGVATARRHEPSNRRRAPIARSSARPRRPSSSTSSCATRRATRSSTSRRTTSRSSRTGRSRPCSTSSVSCPALQRRRSPRRRRLRAVRLSPTSTAAGAEVPLQEQAVTAIVFDWLTDQSRYEAWKAASTLLDQMDAERLRRRVRDRPGAAPPGAVHARHAPAESRRSTTPSRGPPRPARVPTEALVNSLVRQERSAEHTRGRVRRRRQHGALSRPATTRRWPWRPCSSSR